MKWEVFPSKTKDITLKYQGLALHSANDPKKEGERFAKTFLLKNPTTHWNIFLGVGLGYHVISFYYLLKEKKVFPIRMICLFYDREESKLFQEQNKEIIEKNPSEWILICLDELKVDIKLQNAVNKIAYSPWYNHISIVEYLPVIQIDTKRYNHFRQKIVEWLSYEVQNRLTIDYFNPLWAENFLYNLSYFSKSASLMFHGDVILISAGASLSKNFTFLKDYKGKVPLVCVDTALSALLAVDIIPDIVVCCDAQLDNDYDFFSLETKDKKKIEEMILLGSMTQYHQIAKRFFKHILFPTEGMLESWTPFFLGEKIKTLLSGGSVASFALMAISYLGAERIVLVGQDLEYLPLTHVVGSVKHERMIFKSTSRFAPFWNSLKPYLETPEIPARTPMLQNLSTWIRDFFKVYHIQGLYKDPPRETLGIPVYQGETLKGSFLYENDIKTEKTEREIYRIQLQHIFNAQNEKAWLYHKENMSLEHTNIFKVLFDTKEEFSRTEEQKEKYKKGIEKKIMQIQQRILHDFR